MGIHSYGGKQREQGDRLRFNRKSTIGIFGFCFALLCLSVSSSGRPGAMNGMRRGQGMYINISY